MGTFMGTLWEKKITLEAFQKKNTLPETPGVYFFLDENDDILYIGKATSLRDRVKSYFIQDLVATRGPKVFLMLKRIASIGYQRSDSVLEALLLESKLIKKHQPPHNTDAKDDKSYNNVVITKEKFPRVLIVRGRDIEQKKFTAKVKYMFGPFTEGGSLREAMKIVRRLFPYRDTCVPFEELDDKKKIKALPCFCCQIGLCPGVCIGKVSSREYGRTVNHIRLFFEGHKNTLIKELKREMKTAAQDLDFEKAGEIKRTLFGMEHIQDIALIRDDGREKNRHRIEAYDVAHLMGASSVGVMTVVENSRKNPSQYRQFKLREKHNGNDLSALREILMRRLKHEEWPLPEMIAVDGSKLQLGEAEAVLNEMLLSIPVVGVVKNKRHQPERLIGEEALTRRFEKEILLANGEAHRFAITFHRKRQGKDFLGKK